MSSTLEYIFKNYPIMIHLISNFLSYEEIIGMRLISPLINKVIKMNLESIIESIYSPLFEKLINIKQLSISQDSKLTMITELVKYTILALTKDKPIEYKRFNSYEINPLDRQVNEFGHYSLLIRQILVTFFSIFTPNNPENNIILYSVCDGQNIDGIEIEYENDHSLDDENSYYGVYCSNMYYCDDDRNNFCFMLKPLYILLLEIMPEFIKRCISDKIIVCIYERYISLHYLIDDAYVIDDYSESLIHPDRQEFDHTREITSFLKMDIEKHIDPNELNKKILDSLEHIVMHQVAFLRGYSSISDLPHLTKNGYVIKPRVCEDHSSIFRTIIACSGYYYIAQTISNYKYGGMHCTIHHSILYFNKLPIEYAPHNMELDGIEEEFDLSDYTYNM